MENSYFIYSHEQKLDIERFHICSWEFADNKPMIELGFEIDAKDFSENDLSLLIFIPWYDSSCQLKDLYESLKNTANSKFIFNDSIIATKSLDGGGNNFGVIHKFSDRNKLCILPIDFNTEDFWIEVKIDLRTYKQIKQVKPNIYCRFLIQPIKHCISTHKKGLSKTTVIYDFKINERRNIPELLLKDKRKKEYCNIKSCFCFTILPNKYDFVFIDNTSLRSVRTLEYDSFQRYLNFDDKVHKDELIVIFNKKQRDKSLPPRMIESFTFFSMFSHERLGKWQFIAAVILNIFCGMLFFIAAFRSTPIPNTGFFESLKKLPYEIYFAFFVLVIGTILLFWPSVVRKATIWKERSK